MVCKNKILFVEDDEAILDMYRIISEMPKLSNYECFFEETATAGIKVLITENIDIVVSDYSLGRDQLTGCDLASLCGSLVKAPRFILVSGTLEQDRVDDKLPCNCGDEFLSAFIMKPFDIADLISKITGGGDGM